jgi:hypothetical protein
MMRTLAPFALAALATAVQVDSLAATTEESLALANHIKSLAQGYGDDRWDKNANGPFKSFYDSGWGWCN